MIRLALPTDAAEIARVHVDSWRSSYRGLLADEFLDSLSEAGYTDRWRRVIGDGASRVFVVEEAGGIVGFASGGRERAGESGYEGELYAIYIVAGSQRKGHGRELLHAMAAALREKGLRDMIVWVLRDNTAAREFYERLGGTYVRAQPITIGPTTLEEVSYGWRSLDEIR
jgi:ribosomal protein S18 acetylase RimI-like enzyme